MYLLIVVLPVHPTRPPQPPKVVVDAKEWVVIDGGKSAEKPAAA